MQHLKISCKSYEKIVGVLSDIVTFSAHVSSFQTKLYKSTRWPKSNVSKVRAYCSASDNLIRKNFSGVCRDSHWFEEYLKTIEIGDYFFE